MKSSWNRNPLIEAWAQGRCTTNSWLFLPDATAAEIMAHAGFDSLCIDMQHGLIDFAQALDMMRAMSATPIVPLVRAPGLDPNIIGKVLDAGALGIICPMINTADEARQLVSACRYPPRGIRSYGPMRARLHYGDDYRQHADTMTLCFAMIETRGALDQLDAILAVEGLTGVYIGPSDLAMALGTEPKLDPDHPEVVQAIEDIIRRTKAAGKRVGMHNNTPEYAMKMRDLGADFVTIGSDFRMLASAAEQAVRAFHAH